ncbi:hypothetical protein CHH78_20915 [Shouchella clausii]|nr:hypothetical protein CHH76_20765 [Shouchella clausii]PAD93353.1 hypothetical protein CHH52_04360 [Shouchella clausii]PAE78460.1 hypothetical protein CHH78_20915 [Shouchella clausii]PAE97510.1 hypothetical protein CHH71_09085 [Shouchella clausii]PAF03281.1 hypothetical protein CHH66_20855 [Shouchella clausii]
MITSFCVNESKKSPHVKWYTNHKPLLRSMQMDTETLAIYNQAKQKVGTATRKTAHEMGLWHETFHCWIVDDSQTEPYIYLQRRSAHKKDFPRLFDITAAGHLLAGETAEDGIREVKEELGIDIPFADLDFLGQFRCMPKHRDIYDYEFAFTYVYRKHIPFEQFRLQEEEVAGMVRVPFPAFYQLCFGMVEAIESDGFVEEGKIRRPYCEQVTLNDLVPHQQRFLQLVAISIDQLLKNERPR